MYQENEVGAKLEKNKFEASISELKKKNFVSYTEIESYGELIFSWIFAYRIVRYKARINFFLLYITFKSPKTNNTQLLNVIIYLNLFI